MPSLTVLRHSLAAANEQGILMGASRQVDSPLSEKGIALAKAKGASLKAAGFRPDKVFTSQLARARQTAEIILDELGSDADIIELPELNERSFGQYEGKPYAAVFEAFDKYGDNPPTIETAAAVRERVSAALARIKQETTGQTLVISHSSPVMALEAMLLHPEMLAQYWDREDPAYCEGFVYELPN